MKNTIGKQNVQDCGFAESMVSYMYNEIGSADCDEFEAHLVDCVRCTDEFAELSTARLAMFEWNRDEFAHLATPHFADPALAAAAPGKIAAIIDGLRGLLTPLSTAAAAVVVLLVTGVAFYLNSGGSSAEVAANTQRQEQVSPALPAERSAERKLAVPAAEPVEAAPVETKVTKSETDAVKVMVPERSEVIKRPARAPQQAQRAVAVQRSTPKPVNAGKTPVLSSFKETDDKSLRLADLFDDIGG